MCMWMSSSSVEKREAALLDFLADFVECLLNLSALVGA